MQNCYHASAQEADAAFGSIGNAFTFKWTQSGFVSPGQDPVLAAQTLRWAVVSCYKADAVFNLLVLPGSSRHSTIQALLQHPCVQMLLSIPKGCGSFCVPPLFHIRCLDNGSLPKPAIAIIVAANFPGMSRYCPQPSSICTNLHSTLRGSSTSQCKVCTLFPISHPLPCPPRTSGFLPSIHFTPSPAMQIQSLF